MWITTTPCACTAPSASSLRPICWPGGRRRSTPRAIASWRRRAGSGSYVGNRRREMVTMTVPGETEAGNAGMHPCRGIAWWAHRDDDQSAEALPRSSKNQIGSVDPDALKIPARRAEFTLTENARVPFHAEPGHIKNVAIRSSKLGHCFVLLGHRNYALAEVSDPLPEHARVHASGAR